MHTPDTLDVYPFRNIARSVADFRIDSIYKHNIELWYVETGNTCYFHFYVAAIMNGASY